MIVDKNHDVNKENEDGTMRRAEESLEQNPFGKSSRTVRSPVNNREVGSVGLSTPKSPEKYVSIEAEASKSEKASSNILDQLGDQINILVEMISDGKRRSIHQPMRDTIGSIRSLYNRYAAEVRGKTAAKIDCEDTATQTSPWMRNQDAKRRQDGSVETPSAKRKTPISSSGKIGDKTKAASTDVVKEVERTKDAEWQQVERKKKRKKKPQPKRVKPDAIVIATENKATYADILRKVKADPKLSELGKNVTRIRRTNNGGLLLQLRGSNSHTEDFSGAIGELLGESASVRTLKERKTLVIKDIDEITEKEDVSEALQKLPCLAGSCKPEVVMLRRAYGGTQTATISLSADAATALLKEGKIRIGWVVCRIRERSIPMRCYRCLQFGHMARQCKSEVDRSATCRRCGQDGHIARNCAKEPLCMFCREDNPKSAGHIAGSGKCPKFLSALKTRLRK